MIEVEVIKEIPLEGTLRDQAVLNVVMKVIFHGNVQLRNRNHQVALSVEKMVIIRGNVLKLNASTAMKMVTRVETAPKVVVEEVVSIFPHCKLYQQG